jgi:putative phage-type endonuclease
VTAIAKLDERAEWLARRRQSIGASEVAAILGLSPWESAYSLWAKKVYGDDAGDETEWQRWGNIIEPAICEEYSRQTGREVVDHGRYAVRYSETCPHLSATLDREVIGRDKGDGPGCMDAKNVSAFKASDWQDGAPLVYQVQVQAQMEVTGYRWGSLACLLGGNTFRWCDVERNESFIEMMRRKVAEFWKLVEQKTPPPVDGSLSTAEVLKRLYPKDSGESIELPREAADWSAQYEQAQAEIKAAEERKREAQSKLIEAIGAATVGVLPDGTKWTYRTQERKAAVVAASSFRVLRKAR